MSRSQCTPESDRRPECMVTLGLSPPYTLDDVKAAYYSKAQWMHPDHGGLAEDFHQLHEAFERAQEYVAYRVDRRGWIANRMDAYVSLVQAVERVEALGASTCCVTTDWLRDSIGDFAQLTETVAGVRLINSDNGNELVRVLIEELPMLKNVTTIEFPGCHISDESVLRLEVYRELRHLDLSRTPITARALEIVDALPKLQSLNLDGTTVGWWTRRRIEKQVRRKEGQKARMFNSLPAAFRRMYGESTNS